MQDFASLITNINGSYEQITHSKPAMQWLTVTPHHIEGENGVWQFDLPSLIPVSAIRFNNAENIVYYQGQIYSQVHDNPKTSSTDRKKTGKRKLKETIKNAAKGKSRKAPSTRWKTVARFSQYRLLTENGSIESPNIEVSNIKSRRWRIKFDTPVDLLGTQLPKLELGWRPAKLNFIAQGSAPFTLVAGQAAGPVAGQGHGTHKVPFPTTLRNLDNSVEQVSLQGMIDQTASIDEQPQAEQQPGNNIRWAKIALWALLLLAVSLMFYMAYTLIRSMAREQ